ncbi:MAG: NUDIX domain-containing protein [Anaerolineae bacterium]|nr:NUDIX domain-containing protein [Anaerolineae bacterium]
MRRYPLLYGMLFDAINLIAARFTVGVVGVVFNSQGEVLLLEHVFRDRFPWGLPGGWVGRRERPQDALRRELMEEIGLAVRVGAPLVVDMDRPRSHLETSFVCDVEGEVHDLSGEILSVRWFPPDRLPDTLKPFDRQAIRQAQTLNDS